MKLCAITAEYNPFHNGHKYHMEETMRITDCDYLIAIMSGDFTQRGGAAIFNKYERAKAALTAGFDLVLELPAVYATSSADRFALGSISLINKLNCVDYISFGSESADINLLNDICQYQLSEQHTKSESLKQSLKQGTSYRNASALSNTSLASNDILGVSYLKALALTSSNITPVVIKREGGNYYSDAPETLSALSIRQQLLSDSSIDILSDKITRDILSYYKEILKTHRPVCNNDISAAVYQTLSDKLYAGIDLSQYYDVSETIKGKITAHLCDFSTYDEFTDLLLTKDVIASRIRRALLHILFNIKKDDIEQYDQNGYTGYARILGFKESSKELLSLIKSKTDIPLIAKCADARKLLDDTSYKMFKTDMYVADMYEHVIRKQTGKIKPDIAVSPVILS